jgi:aromatic ring-opening dioxygenase LigB subunit
MSIVFAAITPHPPIIIPEIGGKETKKVQKTIDAMEDLSKKLNQAEPDTIIIISPHGLIYNDRINVCGIEKLEGNFAQFNAPQIKMRYNNDLKLAFEIDKTANKESIETLLYDNGDGSKIYELDHGIMVPMYWLTKHLDNLVKIIPIAYSYQDRLKHFAFGQVIASLTQKIKKRIAIIASGDLSHRLIPSAPAGYSDRGEEFDENLVNLIKKNQVPEILELDEDFIEEAGECGFRSILILLGALEKLNYKPQILSYEGPFGVGYLVANFEINQLTRRTI